MAGALGTEGDDPDAEQHGADDLRDRDSATQPPEPHRPRDGCEQPREQRELPPGEAKPGNAVDDGGPVRAEEPFYPVLMSDSGYDDKLGYSAVRVGSLSSVPVE